MKISITGLEARNKAINGVEYVGNAIKSTIGPHGLNFLLEKGNKITNDGYNIASELCPTIKDEFERRGALVAHQASSKTNDEVGDATSTAWALTTEIIKECVRYLPNDKIGKAKKQPSEIIEQLKKERAFVEEELKAMITPITSEEELIKSAKVSVEDDTLAEMLGKMQFELGENGRIVAEETNNTECSIEKGLGIRLDNGFSASHLITNQEKQTMELQNISVFLTNYTIDKKELDLLNKQVFGDLINNKKLAIVLVARAFTEEAIKVCVESMKTGFAIFPVNAPYVDQREIMKDIQAVVGGRYIDVEEGRLEDVYISDIGFARKFVAGQMFGEVAGAEDEEGKERIAKRVEMLEEKMKGEQSDFGKRMLGERIAQLKGGFAILKVGSYSLVERKRLKDKADDAVNAVRHALKGGTVPGAGLAFKQISDKMEDGSLLKRPLRVIYDHIINSAPEDFEIPDWVRDPYIVLSTALKNAVEVAGTISSTNGIITTQDKKECKCDE